MKSKEKRNFVLGSLILVLAISIGYFGISNAGDTYATSTGACYFCTGKSDYVWSDGGGTPSETCNGGIWQKTDRTKANCEYKCYSCTGQPAFKWSIGTPSETCHGGIWSIVDKSQSDCSCTFNTQSACENVYTDYFCEKSGSCWVKSNTKKLGCRYSSASACEEANVGYNCAWNGNTSDFDSSVKCYGTSTKKTFTISYNANGGSGAPANQTKTYGEDLTLSSTKPSRSGYTFLGWSTSSGSTKVSYNAGAKYTANSGIALYAVWEQNPITYTIKFDANGGSGTTKEVKCTYGSNCTLTANAFTRSGYIFNGWNTKKDGTGTSYSDKTVVKNLSSVDGATVTLYAKWKQEKIVVKTYKITFKYNDDVTKDKVVEVDEDDTIPIIEPERKDYIFDGWFTDEELNNKYDFTTKVKGNLTLYAKWTEDNSSDDKIDDSSNDKTDEEISNNSKTGDVMMFIAWTVGIGALAYTVYYYKTRKEN